MAKKSRPTILSIIMGRLALFQEEDQSSDAGNEGHDDFQERTGNAPGKFSSYIGPGHETGDDLDEQSKIEIAFQQISQAAEDGDGQDDQYSRTDGNRKGQSEQDEQDELDERRRPDAEGADRQPTTNPAGAAVSQNREPLCSSAVPTWENGPDSGW